jgi:hypothetical protein
LLFPHLYYRAALLLTTVHTSSFNTHPPSSLLPSTNIEPPAKEPKIDTYLFDNHHEKPQQLYGYLIFTTVVCFVFVAGILMNLVVMISLMIWFRPLLDIDLRIVDAHIITSWLARLLGVLLTLRNIIKCEGPTIVEHG